MPTIRMLEQPLITSYMHDTLHYYSKNMIFMQDAVKIDRMIIIIGYPYSVSISNHESDKDYIET